MKKKAKHSIIVDGAVVVKGHATIFRSDDQMGRYIIVLDTDGAEDIVIEKKVEKGRKKS